MEQILNIMKRTKDYQLAKAIKKELESILPNFIKVTQTYQEDRGKLNGPSHHFLNFECRSTTAIPSKTIVVEVYKGVSVKTVLHEVISDLALYCYSSGKEKARNEVADKLLRSAGLIPIL
jgi:hypothetical protein